MKALLSELLKINDPNDVLDQISVPLESLKTKLAAHPNALERLETTRTSLKRLRTRLGELKNQLGSPQSMATLKALLIDIHSGNHVLRSTLSVLTGNLHQLLNTPEAGQTEFGQEFSAISVQSGIVDALQQQRPCLFTCMLSDPQPYVCVNNDLQPCDPACLAAMDETTKQTILNLGPKARLAAKTTLAPAHAAFERLTRELNLIAISPVFMFDAAKIGAKTSPGGNRTRYGVGTGVQVSIVSLDVRLGYSFNVHRQTSDSRGAFVFSLSVSDLLR
jgi:hypothetical protein